MKEKKLTWYSFREKDGDSDRVIYKYMELEHLLYLLETKRFYVKRRRENEDPNESYTNVKLSFGMTAVGENIPPQPKTDFRMVPYSEIVSLPTSCWTLDSDEKNSMWKEYAPRFGVRVKSSVHNLIASLDIETSEESHNRIICGSMMYEDFFPSTDEERQLFLKDCSYWGEKEFRFYFNLPDDTKKENPAILIPIDPAVLIDEVVISPIVTEIAAKKIAGFLHCCYDIKAFPSNTKINKI